MNFSNLDAPFNKQYLIEGNKDTEIAYMGCVEGKEIINYKINNKQYIEAFEDAYERVSSLSGEQSYGISKYIDTSNSDVMIYDSHSNGFVKCKKFIKNPDKHNWVKITLENGKSIIVTLDHPFPVVNKGRTHTKDIEIGDNLYMTDNSLSAVTLITPIEVNDFSYDVETETDRFDVSGIMSHNCRTRVISNVYDPTRQIVTGRGNLSFTSINLPRLALKATQGRISNGNPIVIKNFYKGLDQMLDLVHKQLLQRFEVQCRKHPRNYPFLMGQGVWIDSDKLGKDDDITEILKHGSLSVGFIGLAETLKCLTGYHHGESEESQKLGLEIIRYMREKTDQWSLEEKMNYGLLATPAEGLSGRYLRMDKQLFGIIPGVTDKEYYTNSSHIPVYYPISIMDKIELEAPYHELENAGHIAYIEVDGDVSNNLPAFEKIIRLMHDNNIGYAAINHPVDYDPVCGYVGVINDVCPKCGRHANEGIPIQNIRDLH